MKVRRGKLDKAVVKKKVVQRLALGEAQAGIAKDTGIHPSQVCRFAKREDVKALIEKERFRLAEAVPDAVQNVKTLVREFSNIPPKETKQRELSYKATADLLRAYGVFPSPVQSQTLIWNSQTTIVSPLIQKILESMASNLTSPHDDLIPFDEEAE
jgi:hypothetical protein